MRLNKATRRNALRLGVQSADLMLAVPQVVANRLARMRALGAGTSKRDQREFHRMGAEKIAAFGESWMQMSLQMMKANQQLARAWMFNPWLPLQTSSMQQSLARAATQLQSVTLQTMLAGIAPVRKRAVSNAKRLRRVKLR